MPNYRQIEETYPFFEANFCIGENGRIGLINGLSVVAYSPLETPRGTKVIVGSISVEIYDPLPSFEDRLQECLAYGAQEETPQAVGVCEADGSINKFDPAQNAGPQSIQDGVTFDLEGVKIEQTPKSTNDQKKKK